MRSPDALGATLLHTATALLLSSAFWACGSDNKSDADASVDLDGATVVDAGIADATAPDSGVDADLRMTLESTGLYSDFANQVIAGDVQEYTPAYPLWSDGAVKRRWVKLPAGQTIDTSDMDFWTYPVGTRLWKEFATPEGLILETRYMEKQGPNQVDWFYMPFEWNMAQTEAFEVENGSMDVLGTQFDIPSLRNCRKCHERQPDFVLGFSAIQLAHENTGVNLASLVADNSLSVVPTGTSPYFTIPGSANEKAVLGYLHSNCGGCHHPLSDVKDTTNLRLRLEVGGLATVSATTIYSTTIGIAPLLSGLPGSVPVTSLIEPGNPEASAIYVRMNLRDGSGGQQMPPRGTEVVDQAALAELVMWINTLAE
ncbi:MAG: hypothetical protein JKY56_24335 [Kofleriaceae bacterium]|nr:hypothetical protein [Kofleriaceae bacterium]